MYVIFFKGLFEYGYVKNTYTKKPRDIKFDTLKQSREFATKYRFKWMADLFCKLYNWSSKKQCALRTFTVEKYIND